MRIAPTRFSDDTRRRERLASYAVLAGLITICLMCAAIGAAGMAAYVAVEPMEFVQ